MKELKLLAGHVAVKAKMKNQPCVVVEEVWRGICSMVNVFVFGLFGTESYNLIMKSFFRLLEVKSW